MSSASGPDRGRRTRRRPGGAFERRPWGGFSTLEDGPGYKVKRLVVDPGHRFSYQKHARRAEHWTVVAGAPRVILDGRPRRLRVRDAIAIPRGAWHRAENRGRRPVVIIEVQLGAYLGEDDIVRRQDDYGRAGDGRAPAPPRRRPVKRRSPKRRPPAR